MATLVEVLEDPARRDAVIRDGAKLIDAEVASKSGMRAMALKAGFRTLKKIKPAILESSVAMLLPHFAPAIDPFYATALASGDVHTYFKAHDAEIADAMLAVTDARAERAKNKVMKRVYSSLRGQARAHVVAAIPGLANLICTHVGG